MSDEEIRSAVSKAHNRLLFALGVLEEMTTGNLSHHRNKCKAQIQWAMQPLKEAAEELRARAAPPEPPEKGGAG